MVVHPGTPAIVTRLYGWSVTRGSATWIKNYCKSNLYCDLRLAQERFGTRRKGRLHRHATPNDRSVGRFHDVQGQHVQGDLSHFCEFQRLIIWQIGAEAQSNGVLVPVVY